MTTNSIRYDISTAARLIRAIPVVLLYALVILVVLYSMPEKAQSLPLEAIMSIGTIGAFRYLWLLTHCVRAIIYEHYIYPKMRFEADRLPDSESMPQQIFFIIPTSGEKLDVSRRMLSSVLDEAATIPSYVKIIINAGSQTDDDVFKALIEERPVPLNVSIRYIRQHGGKRGGMADCLAKLINEPVEDNDLVVLMDGDTVLGSGVMRKCAPLFKTRPRLGAVTTDNIAVTTGNWLYRKWYTLRFSMRHRIMKSQSLSRQLLVLTGRFSVIRAKEAFTDEFVSYLENDRIKHWLHGEIKFVTGDDKSTWYCLLRRGCEMLYVPDAYIFCMEDSGREPFIGTVKKMHRWFGNMLRNNGRAIGLGLGRQKPFIWWCHIDQRISIFTSLFGPIAALWSSIWISPYILVVYMITVLLTRMLYMMILVIEGHRLSIADVPLLLYTQWGGSMIKVYTMFHLHRQKWDAHRQASNTAKKDEAFFDWLIPKVQVVLCYSLLLLFVAILVGTE